MGSMAQFSKRVEGQMSRRQKYAKKFNIPITSGWRKKQQLSAAAMDQLDRCADDSARRVLLGIGRPR